MKKYCIIPFYESQNQNQIFNSTSPSNRDNVLEPFIMLKNYFKEKGIDLCTPDINKIDKSEKIICLNLSAHTLLSLFIHNKLRVTTYLHFEPPIVNPMHSELNLKILGKLFGNVLTWNDEVIDEDQLFKFYFPIPRMNNDFKVPFQDKNMIVNISGFKQSRMKNELYSSRISIIKYFERNGRDRFDLYGYGWDASEFMTYKGSVKNKMEILKKYKFSICFENMHNISGLVSEKIFDCLIAGSVPVFWGATNIADFVPSNCYIDMRKFTSYVELDNFLCNMSEDEYNKYISAIDIFLKSAMYKKFEPKNFCETINKVINLQKGSNRILELIILLYELFYMCISNFRVILDKFLSRKWWKKLKLRKLH